MGDINIIMSSDIPNIKTFNSLQEFIPGDKIIVEKADDKKVYLVDFDNIYVTSDQVSFNNEINQDIQRVADLQAHSVIKYNELVYELEEKNIGRSTAQLIDITSSTSTGTLSSSNYREFITSTLSPYSGPNNLVVFDSALVDKLDINIDGAEDTENVDCDIDRVVYGAGTLSIPKGTYRIRASISLSPETDIDLQQETIDEYIERKQQIWAYLSFVQLTGPGRVVLNGSGGSTFNTVGSSITLTLNGFFYTDTTRQYGLKVHTLGRLYPGVVTGTYPQDITDSTLSERYLSLSSLFGRNQFNQSRLIIERISDTNTLSPLEDSPAGYRSQSLELVPRIPLIYNAGWLQKIDAQDTSVIPSTEKTQISAMPFVYREDLDAEIGDLRGYITEPKSHQGYVKIGDTVRYRVQQPNSNGVLDPIYNKYDIRDASLKTLDPGWYGMIVSPTKVVAEQYDTIFRLDKNGVVSQRVYLSDPNTFYQNCILGDTPTNSTNQPITGDSNFIAAGSVLAVNGSSVNYIIPENGPTHIHVVCVGGGEGGSRSKYNSNNKEYTNSKSGAGGDLVYTNFIEVEAGDILTLSPGRAGTGKTAKSDGEAGNPGGDSILYITKKKSPLIQTLIARARGGGSTNGSFVSNNGIIHYGGRGRVSVLTRTSNGELKDEYASGGGGAGGYAGSGGTGGKRGTSRAENGTGGGGGGGGFSKGNQSSGGFGGGVGLLGIGPNGVKGEDGADDVSDRNGSPGSGGSAKTYGGGGRGLDRETIDLSTGDGGPGAVRVIWGTNKSFPFNAS